MEVSRKELEQSSNLLQGKKIVVSENLMFIHEMKSNR